MPRPRRYEPAIPMRLISPLVERWLSENPVRTRNTENVLLGTSEQEHGNITVLAQKAQLNVRTISAIRRGNRSIKEGHKRVSFDAADRILCAMDMVHLWWEWPLVVWYARGIPELAHEREREAVAA